MSEEPLKFSEAVEGDGRQEAVMHLVALMHSVAGPASFGLFPDPRDGIAVLVTAANMYAGAQFGTLMLMGEVTQQDTKRAADMAARNFREGIKVGLAHGRRVETEMHGAGRA